MSHQQTSVSGDFDQEGLCNLAKASSNTHFHRKVVQRSPLYVRAKDPGVRKEERPTEPRNLCKEKHKHKNPKWSLCAQGTNLSIIH